MFRLVPTGDLPPLPLHEARGVCLARTLRAAGYGAQLRRHDRHFEVEIGAGFPGEHVDLYPGGRVAIRVRDPGAAAIIAAWAATR